MNSDIHAVQPGDTLSHIAQRYRTTVEHLLELNPFIRDPDYIQAGWHLQVPAAQLQTDNAQAEPQPLADKPILQLDPVTDSPTPCEASFEQASSTPACSPVYHSILYSPEDQEFWLLPEHAQATLQEAVHTLQNLIAPEKSPDERKKGLDKSGLLEYFLEPKLVNFLEGEQRERMLQIEAEEPYIAHPTLAANARAAELDSRPAPELAERDFAYPDQSLRALEHARRFQVLHAEWKALSRIAIKAAQREGYTYEDGRLFTPQAMEARKCVQDYLQARQECLEQEEIPDADDIAHLLSEKARRYEQAMDCTVNCRATFSTYMHWTEQHEAKLKYAAYTEAIFKIADYGLAVPELALIQNNDPATGIKRFKAYLENERQQRLLQDRIHAKYQDWIEASGQNAQAPAGLVEAERTEWDRLQAANEALRQEAEQSVLDTFPRRHLLWHPETFRPEPEQRLVKSNFPLREFSVVGSEPPLEHFSLDHLFSLRALRATATQATRENLKDARRLPANSDGRAAQDSASNAFRTWLLEQGAIQLDDQAGDWFDTEGWFDIERFHQYLQQQQYRITQLDNPDARRNWGEQLRQILFRADVRSALRLFDTSPQAQLVRCLSPMPATIHRRIELQGPSITLADGATAQASASLDIDLARGEVELLKIDLPERHKARDIQLTYHDHRGELAKMNLGRFSVHCAARAWGYAGASVLVSASLELSPYNTLPVFTLDPTQPAERPPLIKDGAKASFNAFAGVQAGIVITGALNWAPPVALAQLRAPAAGSDPWLSLARLDIDLSAAAGFGISGEAALSLHEGKKLVLTLKAAVIGGPGAQGELKFEVGYQAVCDIINLFRRELHRNQGKPLNWVSDDAATFMTRLNLLGSVGLDVTMLYLMGLDLVFSLYEAITRGGKGGPIAHAIMTYKKPGELQQWFVEAPPAALGPMLMTLISTPKAFSVVSTTIDHAGKPIEENIVYGETDAHLLQQQAIERILGWLVQHAQRQGTLGDAGRQFTEACMRMNRFGSLPADAGQMYCEKRLELDNFMAEAVLRLEHPRNDQMRARYKTHVQLLGADLDGFCRRIHYQGASYIPARHAKYIGPSI
jgi:hypothetical protein